jgi:hypothetical protein
MRARNQRAQMTANFSTLKMEAIRPSETSVYTSSIPRHIPKDGIFHMRIFFLPLSRRKLEPLSAGSYNFACFCIDVWLISLSSLPKVYLTTLLVTQIIYRWIVYVMIGENWVEQSCHGLIWSTVPACVWRDWKPTDRIGSLLVEMWTAVSLITSWSTNRWTATFGVSYSWV